MPSLSGPVHYVFCGKKAADCIMMAAARTLAAVASPIINAVGRPAQKKISDQINDAGSRETCRHSLKWKIKWKIW